MSALGQKRTCAVQNAMSALCHRGSSFDGSRQKNNAWPVDARMLRAPHKAQNSGRLIFGRQEDGRTKTGRAAIGTLSKRTERLVATCLATLGIDLHPEAVLFRNKSGNLYREDSLAHDFASVRELAFPGDIVKDAMVDLDLKKITHPIFWSRSARGPLRLR